MKFIDYLFLLIYFEKENKGKMFFIHVLTFFMDNITQKSVK